MFLYCSITKIASSRSSFSPSLFVRCLLAVHLRERHAYHLSRHLFYGVPFGGPFLPIRDPTGPAVAISGADPLASVSHAGRRRRSALTRGAHKCLEVERGREQLLITA